MQYFKIIILVVALLGFTIAPSSGLAQSTVRLSQALSEMNNIKPMQNPKWERAADVLKNRILDRKNKVVGEVEDITVGKQGVIESLKVDLDRLQLGSDVYLDYDGMNIRSADRAFITDFDDDKIEELYPQLLANMETAAGGDDSLISIRDLNNADVQAADGRRLGKVEEVMFDTNSGNRAEALIIRVRATGVRGESVAVPFYMPEYKVASASRYDVVLSNEQADIVLEIARGR